MVVALALHARGPGFDPPYLQKFFAFSHILSFQRFFPKREEEEEENPSDESEEEKEVVTLSQKLMPSVSSQPVPAAVTVSFRF